MIWTIAKKEFLEKILDFRVVISFIIAIALILVATIVASGDYHAKKVEYDKLLTESQSILSSIKVYSQYKPVVYLPPSPLSVFSRGIDIPTPITVNIEINEVPLYKPREAGLNPMMSIFDSLDIATVARVLFSLLVILLTFDSFSGEKEQGTLRLALSNPVARMNILYGKFIGTIMIISFVVFLTYILTIIMVRVFSGIPIESGSYLRVLLMAIATIFYLALLGALGIIASLKFNHSSTSLAVLLLLWFFLAILQPNLNTYIVTEFENKQWLQNAQSVFTDDNCGAMKELEQLQQQYGSLFEDPTKRVYYSALGYSTVIGWGNIRIRPIITDATYDILEYGMQQIRIYRKLGNCAEKEFDLYKNHFITNLNKQLKWKRTLELLSPAAMYSRTIAILSQSDIDNVDDFFEQARQYRTQYLTYLDQKGIFSNNAYLYFSRLSKDQINRKATEQRMALYMQNPNLVPYINDQPPLDMRDAPIFNAQQSNITTDFSKAVGSFVPTLFYFAILFFMSGKSMKSYDLR
ncbi:MAG: ABC transporter permease subunit [Bacteroidia bacterium]|nr:ABC transporter permease subunit [Bacteroidia bacterium]MBI5021175.1 ABC transporter permease subunit [Ignavibacteriales bacterium]